MGVLGVTSSNKILEFKGHKSDLTNELDRAVGISAGTQGPLRHRTEYGEGDGRQVWSPHIAHGAGPFRQIHFTRKMKGLNCGI